MLSQINMCYYQIHVLFKFLLLVVMIAYELLPIGPGFVSCEGPTCQGCLLDVVECSVVTFNMLRASVVLYSPGKRPYDGLET